jgi:arylformamidase
LSKWVCLTLGEMYWYDYQTTITMKIDTGEVRLPAYTSIVDLSHPLESSTPVYPGDGGVRIVIVESTGDPPRDRRNLNCSRLELTNHNGTHMDAPYHFFEDGRTIDKVDLLRCCGAALMIDLRSISPRGIFDTDDLSPFKDRLSNVGKVVLHTGWYHHWNSSDYFTGHPVLTGEAARFLVDCGVHLVGVDTPSIDMAPFPAHIELLSRGVVIVENLTNLEKVRQEMFHLLVLPLKISGRDASPVRAVALEA